MYQFIVSSFSSELWVGKQVVLEGLRVWKMINKCYVFWSKPYQLKKLLIQSFIDFGRMMKQESSKESILQNNKSSLNTSKSKAMYTFSKEDRFPHLPPQGSYEFYEKQPMLSKRAPSFGYGHKIDISLNNHSPSPDRYTLASDFQKSPKKGLTIGHSRQQCKSVSIFSQTAFPGPGNYNIRNDKENIKNMTMSPKLKFPSLWNESISPGPGKYEVQKIDSNGSCLISKYKSKNSFRIIQKSPEKENKGLERIGPGTYDTNFSSTGKQVLARNKTQKSFIFGKKLRETMKEFTLSPGPGAYQHYSAFGMI